MGWALSLVRIDRHHTLGSGSEMLHAEARRKAEARGEKTMVNEGNPLTRYSFSLHGSLRPSATSA